MKSTSIAHCSVCDDLIRFQPRVRFLSGAISQRDIEAGSWKHADSSKKGVCAGEGGKVQPNDTRSPSSDLSFHSRNPEAMSTELNDGTGKWR
jgi:hypothetical protein